jgi:L-ascorbate metabolism protein UlaG (beta-lactamase superfamily)
VEIRFLGHSCFELIEGDTRVLLDPFLSDNPSAAVGPDEVDPTHIFLTHGDFDHYGDIEEIAKRTGAQVVSASEIASELTEAGLDNVADPNIGGTVTFDWGWVKLTPAWHTSVTPKGQVNVPAGLLINIGGKTVYHLGDTALFSDLKLVAGRGDPIDVALMCIGGHYTMDRIDAVTAAEFVGARTVIPCHYNTFPPIETDPEAFKAEVEARTSSKVQILQPGESFSP